MDNLQFVEADDRKPRPGEVRVHIRASSLNFHDDLVVRGKIPCADLRVPLSDGAGIVVAVGEGLCHSPRTLERATRALGPIAPELVSFGGNERNLSFVVRYDDMAATMQRLHAEFFGEAGALRSDEARQHAAPPAAQRTLEASP